MPASYEDRMLRVLDYIHDNPAGDLSLDALADAAAMSRFHWHRVFHGITGETCADAVRRIRLHRAACSLVQTDLAIGQVAKACGYPNLQSFTRVFREGYGLTPAAFRQRGEVRSLLSPNAKGARFMYPVETLNVETRRLFAIAHEGPYLEIGRAFEKLSHIAGSRGLWPHAQGMVGLYYDDPSAVAPEDLRSYAALIMGPDAELPDILEELEYDGGKFAVLHYKGPYSELKPAYDYLFGKWLPESGEEPRDAPAMEIYLNNPADTDPEQLLTDICMPVA